MKLVCSTRYGTKSLTSTSGIASAEAAYTGNIPSGLAPVDVCHQWKLRIHIPTKGSLPSMASSFSLYLLLASSLRLAAYGDRPAMTSCTPTWRLKVHDVKNDHMMKTPYWKDASHNTLGYSIERMHLLYIQLLY